MINLVSHLFGDPLTHHPPTHPLTHPPTHLPTHPPTQASTQPRRAKALLEMAAPGLRFVPRPGRGELSTHPPSGKSVSLGPLSVSPRGSTKTPRRKREPCLMPRACANSGVGSQCQNGRSKPRIGAWKGGRRWCFCQCQVSFACLKTVRVPPSGHAARSSFRRGFLAVTRACLPQT